MALTPAVAPPPARGPERDGEAALRARSLYRFFRAGDEETLALRGVSLSLAAGELVAVTGPSGSGKSTLLSCLAGVDEPDGGTVWVGDRRLSHQSESVRTRLRATRIGILGQSDNLFEHLSLEDNVRFVRSLAPPSPGPGARDLLAVAGLAARAHARPRELSGGEATRAGLVLALANSPAVLLADEPTGELDTVTEAEILRLLARTARGGVAVLVASHSPAVTRVADRVLLLDDGRLIT